MTRGEIELEELQLKNEKLREEIRHARLPFYRTPTTLIATVGAIVTIMGATTQCTRIGIEKEKEGIAFERKLLESERKQKELITKNEQISAELDQLKDEQTLLTNQNAEAKRVNSGLRTEFASLQQSIADTRSKYQAQQKELHELEARLSKAGPSEALTVISEASRTQVKLDESLAQLEDRASLRSVPESPDPADKSLPTLLRLINSPDRRARLAAVERVSREFLRSSEDLSLCVSLLESPQLETLTASGRVNALWILQGSQKNLWTPDLKLRADAALSTIEQRSKAGKAVIGSETRNSINKLQSKLQSLKFNGK